MAPEEIKPEQQADIPEETEDSPFVEQVMRDAEAIATAEEPYERFFVIDVDRGSKIAYAIWDDQTNDYYVDEEGVTEEFDSEWLANDYLQEVKKAVAAREAAEWEHIEHAKFEAVSEPSYQVGDTV